MMGLEDVEFLYVAIVLGVVLWAIVSSCAYYGCVIPWSRVIAWCKRMAAQHRRPRGRR